MHVAKFLLQKFKTHVFLYFSFPMTTKPIKTDQPLWPEQMNRDAFSVLSIALLYYQEPTFPPVRHDRADCEQYLSQFDVQADKKSKPIPEVEDW